MLFKAVFEHIINIFQKLLIDTKNDALATAQNKSGGRLKIYICQGVISDDK